MPSFEYLADGHHVDYAGNLIFCTYVDFRDPAERPADYGPAEGVVEAARDSGLRDDPDLEAALLPRTGGKGLPTTTRTDRNPG